MKDPLSKIDTIVARASWVNVLIDHIAGWLVPKHVVIAGGGCATSQCIVNCDQNGSRGCGGLQTLCHGVKLVRNCDASCSCTPWLLTCNHCCFFCP